MKIVGYLVVAVEILVMVMPAKLKKAIVRRSKKNDANRRPLLPSCRKPWIASSTTKRGGTPKFPAGMK